MGRPPKKTNAIHGYEETKDQPLQLEKWPPEDHARPEDDELAVTTERAIIVLLNSNLDPKDMNAAIANAIRMLQLKHKLQPAMEEGSFFGDGNN